MMLDLSDPRVKRVLYNWLKVYAWNSYTDAEIHVLAGDMLKHLEDVAKDQHANSIQD